MFRSVLTVVAFVACCAASFFLGKEHERSSAISTTGNKFLPQPVRAGRSVQLAAERTPEQIAAYGLKVEGAPAAAAEAPKPKPKPKPAAPAADAAAKPKPKPKPAAPAKPPAPTLDLTKEPGVTKPFGFWDPIGLSRDQPADKLRWFQEAEVKHGRIAMLAALGVIWSEQSHDLFGSWGGLLQGDASGPAIESWKAIPPTFWGALFAWMGYVENETVQKLEMPAGKMVPEGSIDNPLGLRFKDDYAPGDFKWDPLFFKKQETSELKEQKTKELNNGRLAMLGIAGMVAQEMVTGKTIFTPPPPASAAEFDALVTEMTQVLQGVHVH